MLLTSCCCYAGFKLESLLKLVDCRGSQDCKSLLHFILDQLLQDAPEIQALPKELLTVQPAAKLQVCTSIPTKLLTVVMGAKVQRVSLGFDIRLRPSPCK